MVERQYAAQPQPIAAAEMAGAKDDKRGRKGSAYEYKGFQTPSLRRRAQGNHGASGLVPPPKGRALSGTCALACRVGTASAKKSSRDLTSQSCARIDDVHPFGNRT